MGEVPINKYTSINLKQAYTATHHKEFVYKKYIKVSK